MRIVAVKGNTFVNLCVVRKSDGIRRRGGSILGEDGPEEIG
jgi:hypothetical protein